MLTGAVKALQTLPVETLQVTLYPMIQLSLDSLITIVSREHQLRLGKDIILSSCNLIQKTISLLKDSLCCLQFFDVVTNALLSCLRVNPFNYLCCL